MKKRARYFVCRNNLEFGNKQFILSTKPPFPMGLVVFFVSDLDYVEYTNQYTGLAYAQVERYKILIEFYHALLSPMPVNRLTPGDLKLEMERMGRFYLEHEIETNPTLYRKFQF